MSRRRAARAVGLLGLVLVLVALVPAPARAVTATVTETGWWTRRVGAAEQPAGGFEVAAGLQGEESVAALRVDVSGGTASAATLVLAEAGGFGASGAALQVCATSDAWTAANPGAYADAPEASCDGAASLARDDAGQWTADVTALVAGALGGGTVSLVVAPAPPATGLPIEAPFDVQLSSAQLQVTDASGVGAGFGSLPPTTAYTFQPPAATPALPSTAFAPPVPPSAFPPAALPPATIVGAPAAPATPAVDAAAPTAGTFQPVASTGPGKPWGRLLWMVPLSAAVGAAATAARRWLLGTAPPGLRA